MPTFYNWCIKRSGAGLRIIGDVAIGADETIFAKDHKISNIGSIVLTGGIIQAIDRDTGKVVAVLSMQ